MEMKAEQSGEKKARQIDCEREWSVQGGTVYVLEHLSVNETGRIFWKAFVPKPNGPLCEGLICG